MTVTFFGIHEYWGRYHAPSKILPDTLLVQKLLQIPLLERYLKYLLCYFSNISTITWRCRCSSLLLLTLSLDSFLSHKRFTNTSPQALLQFTPHSCPWAKKLDFEINTKPVTQAAIIVGVVAFASGSLATIAIYISSPIAGIICAVVLVIVVYLALCLAPH